MRADEEILQRLRGLVEPILAEAGMELVELTCRPQGHQVLVRLLVDQPGSVTLQRCATINQRVSGALEAANLFEGSYTVEVSSPGLDRPLTTKRDFERALGEDVRLELSADDGRTKELQGVMLAVQPEAIVVKTPAGNVTVSLAQIRLAKKTVRW